MTKEYHTDSWGKWRVTDDKPPFQTRVLVEPSALFKEDADKNQREHRAVAENRAERIRQMQVESDPTKKFDLFLALYPVGSLING